MVIPLARSSGALSMSPYDLNFAPPAFASTVREEDIHGTAVLVLSTTLNFDLW